MCPCACLILVLVMSLLQGCAERVFPDDPPQASPGEPFTLAITPAELDLVVSGVDVAVRLSAHSSRHGDVSALAVWSSSDGALASITGGVLVVRGDISRGGSFLVMATHGAQTASARVRVKLVAPDHLHESAPDGAPAYFTGGAGGPRPAWVYPLQGTMLPRNHVGMSLMFEGGGGAAFRIRVESATYAQDIYLGQGACVEGRCRFDVPDALWTALSRSAAGASATLTLEASAGTSGPRGSAEPLTLRFSPEDVRGGLYYWSTTINGLYRVPVGTRRPQVFIDRGNEFGCAGCHAVSRDGRKVALAFGSANGVGGGIVDGMNGKRYLLKPPMAGQWNLQTFSPRGDMLLVNWRGAAHVISTETGQRLFDVPPKLVGGRIAQPEWSPDGRSIVFVRYPPEGHGDEWMAWNTGDIMIMPWNDGRFGPPELIVRASPGREYHFYPSFTPDSRFVIFNTGQVPCGGLAVDGCNTYDPVNTRLRLVRALPGQKPIELGNASHRPGSSTNWPRVAPFMQDGGRLIFFTFSAKFPFGFATRGKNPQIWMAAVDLERAARDPERDPSYAPFWLPFQREDESNHLGTWTTDLVCTDDSGCPGELLCVSGLCAPRTPG